MKYQCNLWWNKFTHRFPTGQISDFAKEKKCNGRIYYILQYFSQWKNCKWNRLQKHGAGFHIILPYLLLLVWLCQSFFKV